MIIITEKYRVLAQNDFILKGQCKRCGACCLRLNCQYLEFETLNDTKQAVCKIYNKRPVWCAIWPQIDDTLPDKCGFYWEKI